MQNKHVDILVATMHFHFVGKSGKERTTGSLEQNAAAAICRKCYIHPGVLDMYLYGTMLHALEQRAEPVLICC